MSHTTYTLTYTHAHVRTRTHTYTHHTQARKDTCTHTHTHTKYHLIVKEKKLLMKYLKGMHFLGLVMLVGAVNVVVLSEKQL